MCFDENESAVLIGLHGTGNWAPHVRHFYLLHDFVRVVETDDPH